MARDEMFGDRVRRAIRADTAAALQESDGARSWLDGRPGPGERGNPLGAEVWVFDEALARVLLVRHPRRGWVPPGGQVEPGETPREGAARELREETGLRPPLRPEPAAAVVRSFQEGVPAALSLSYAAVVDAAAARLVPEDGQPAAWLPLDRPWESWFPDDRDRMRRHAAWLADGEGGRRGAS